MAPTWPSEWESTLATFRNHHAAVPYRRLRLLRSRGGIEGCDAGAAGGVRTGPRARNVRDLSWKRDDRRADDAGRDVGTSIVRNHRSFVYQGDLFGRLDGPGHA